MVEVNVTRRQFIKLSGAMAVTLAVAELGFNENEVKAKTSTFKIAELKPTPTICPYCAVGCGILVYSNGQHSCNEEIWGLNIKKPLGKI